MDVHLDLNMTMLRPLDGLQHVEYVKDFRDIYKPLQKRRENHPDQPGTIEEEQDLRLA